MLLEDLTGKVISAFYKVYNTLGYGFLEKVYERAMYIELKKMGFQCICQNEVNVYYENEVVGVYFSDITVEDCLILELKAAENIGEDHEAQLINYLKASKMEVGLLLDFGKTPQFKRKIYTKR
jgi:GxxExxY protein